MRLLSLGTPGYIFFRKGGEGGMFSLEEIKPGAGYLFPKARPDVVGARSTVLITRLVRRAPTMPSICGNCRLQRSDGRRVDARRGKGVMKGGIPVMKDS